eukprot:m.66893 g.66893  ORF g.66893 m.66893 type:complete len:471 (-) comp9836_c0_seq1:243-1655(-)
MQRLRADAEAIFRAAVGAVAPDRLIARALRRDGDTLTLVHSGTTFDLATNVKVYGFGKAVSGMVAAADAMLHDHIVGGVASIPLGTVDTLRASHPHLLPQPTSKVELCEGADGNMPDAAAAATAARILTEVTAATADDLVILLISGGGSALLPVPAGGITLEETQAATAALARRGATIDQLNCVRKHISAVQGGQLALAAHPATVVALILSDVVGDSLETIASGPTVPDSTSFRDALGVVETLGAAEALPPQVLARLQAGVRGEIPDTPTASAPQFVSAQGWLHNELVGTNQIALTAAEAAAAARGYTVHRQVTPLEGDARDAARDFVSRLHGLSTQAGGTTAAATRHCILAGGETTCVVTGRGRGGRNQELALQAGMLMESVPQAVLLSGGTDGQDGPTDAAGGFADASLLAECKTAGIDPHAYLADNDSFHALDRLNRLLRTGLTGTNVMDVVVGLVECSPNGASPSL